MERFSTAVAWHVAFLATLVLGDRPTARYKPGACMRDIFVLDRPLVCHHIYSAVVESAHGLYLVPITDRTSLLTWMYSRYCPS